MKQEESQSPITDSAHGDLLCGQEEEVIALLHACYEATSSKVFLQ